MMTETEKRRQAAAKGAQTAREHRAKWKERERERQAEQAAQLAALRKVRDAEDSTAEMRLEAVKLIEKIGGEYHY